MKYMTFNSSCSYAGLANMLSFYGVDTTDRQIALNMGLPYFFTYEDGCYLAGASLQNAEWFNLYLNPRGFQLEEQALSKEDMCSYLSRQKCAMLGIHMESAGKHAVIYTGVQDGKLCFLNNKWETDPSPETLLLTEEELLQRIDDTFVVATLQTTAAKAAPIQEKLKQSLSILKQYHQALTEICTQTRPTVQLRKLLNPMFRALLLDGIAMLELLGNPEPHSQLVTLQRSFLSTMRTEAPEIRLSEHLSMDLLDQAVEQYAKLIEHELKTHKTRWI